MCRKELIRRYTTFIVSVFIIAFGLSGIVRSDLGTSPISSTPFVFSINTPITIGSCLFVLCLLFILIQMTMLTKREIAERKVELLAQIPISFIFGLCTDLTMWVLSDVEPQTYYAKMATLIAGCFILAFGICLEVIASVMMMGGELTVQIASNRFNKGFGASKMIFDITLVVIAIISSLLFSSTIEGIREGTIIVALLTGPFVRMIMPWLKFVGRWQEVTPFKNQ